MLEDASNDKAARIYEESQVDQEDMPSEDSDKDPEFEILFLRRRSKLNEKLKEAAEAALKYENHK